MKKLNELQGGKLNGCNCFCLFAAKVFCTITKYEINKIFILVMLPMLCSCSAEKNLGLEQAKYMVLYWFSVKWTKPFYIFRDKACLRQEVF